MADADLLIPLGETPITVDGQIVTVAGDPVTLYTGVTADLASECFRVKKWWHLVVVKVWRFEVIGKCGGKMPIIIKTKKAPAERIVIPFDFEHELSTGETLSSIVSVTVSVYSGTDASVGSMQTPSAAIEEGGKRVLVPLRNGVDGAVYDVTVLADTSNVNKRLSITGRLTVATGA